MTSESPQRRPTGKKPRPTGKQPRPTGQHQRPSGRRPTGTQRRPQRRPTGQHARPEGDKGDLRQQITDKARVVSVDKLTRGGTKFVRVISPDTIVQIVGDSLEAALADHSGLLTEEERQAIAKDARVGFSQLLIQHKKLIDQREELQDKLKEEQAGKEAAAKQQEELESEVAKLRGSLENEKTKLARERERLEGVKISGESMDDLEQRLHGLLRRMLSEGELRPPDAPEGEIFGIGGFERRLEELVSAVLTKERRKFGGRDAEAQEQIEFLERRIAKLSSSLTGKEEQLNAYTGDEERAKETYYGASPGIDPSAQRYEWKKQVLKMFTEDTAGVLEKKDEPAE